MKKWSAVVFLFLVVLLTWGLAQEIKPVAVSPGSERGVARVSERCPTFSWSAIGWATGYRVAVFEAKMSEVKTYESMALSAAPVLTQDIPGKALSWTPSEEASLRDDGLYVWYVQARDASGNGLWSSGKAFVVEVEKKPFLGLEERVGKKLRTRSVSADVIAEAIKELRGGERAGAIAKGFTLKPSAQTSAGLPSSGGGLGGVRTQGNEGDANLNTYYGTGAGASLTLGANYNSIFGYQAGNQTTSGDDNTYVGYRAGYSGTIASSNTFVGYCAGYFNTVSNNTFLGGNAGYSSTTGSDNTFLGASAGYFNTTGSDNTFLGYIAGASNTIGFNNTFLGSGAGYSNSTGSNNANLGYHAGYSNSAGSYNTMIGYFAGFANKASSNTFLGYSSGRDTTTGTYNTFFGQNAGRFNTTGSNNVYLGLNSSYYNTSGGNNVVMGVTAGFNNAGSGNVILGYRAGYYETGSNKLYIDNYSDTFPLIYGDFSTGKLGVNGYLGVGVQTPAYRIQVAGGAYCNGTTWTNASSRALKENIRDLTADDAQNALAQLAPVRFNYKADCGEEHVGFIAEDVPELVATGDRTGLSPMDIVAVLTKVVQEQQKIVQNQQKTNDGLKKTVGDQQKAIDEQRAMIIELRAEIESLKRHER